jgi:hypothetical protein
MIGFLAHASVWRALSQGDSMVRSSCPDIVCRVLLIWVSSVILNSEHGMPDIDIDMLKCRRQC